MKSPCLSYSNLALTLLLLCLWVPKSHSEQYSPSYVSNILAKEMADKDEHDDTFSAEYSLYNKLLGSNRYQKHVRPVRNHHQPIKVKVGMCVMMVEEIVERDQIMTMAACIKMRWTDDFLVWRPEKYDNLSWLAISSTNIWLPDIAIINSPEPYELTRKETNVDVDFRGEVGFFPSGRLATRCNLQITYFPFDWQHCEVRLESWIYPTQYLEIEMYPDDTVDLKEYYTNHQWAVAGYRVLPEVADYDGKNFSSITFTYILRRKSEYYFMYFIFPQLLLALLQTLSHTLPVEHPGRMAMLTSLFIGTSVTQAGIAVHIPKSSDSMSLLQMYMTIMSVNLVFALIVTFVMMYAVLRYPNEEPSFIAMMAAFFSIVWPSDIDKKGKSKYVHRSISKASSKAIFLKKPNISNMTCHLSSPFGDFSKALEEQKAPADYTLKIQEGGDSSNDRSGKKDKSKRQKKHGDHSKKSKFNGVLDNPKDMTSFRQIVAKQSGMNVPQSAIINSTLDNKKTSGPSEEDDDEEQQWLSQVSRSHTESTVKQPGYLAFPISTHQYIVGMDSSTDEDEDYSPMNPMIDVKAESQQQSDGEFNSNTLDSTNNDGTRRRHASKSSPRRKKPLQARSTFINQASAIDETRELKRRWLLYCVALDKTIMYANMVWNVVVPLLLFAIVPVLSPHPFLHVSVFYEKYRWLFDTEMKLFPANYFWSATFVTFWLICFASIFKTSENLVMREQSRYKTGVQTSPPDKLLQSIKYKHESINPTNNFMYALEPPERSDEYSDNEDEDFVSHEFELYERLLGSKSRYHKTVRPVRHDHETVKVQCGMCVMMIQEIVIYHLEEKKWRDTFLRWNPEKYGGVKLIAVPSRRIWLPDIAIVNSPEPNKLSRAETSVEVLYNGEVGFFPQGTLVSRCNLKLRYFPLDTQRCEIRLESWIYNTKHLQIEMLPQEVVDIKQHYVSHEWSVSGYDVTLETASYDGHNFSSITFYYILRRKSSYYITYFVLPQFMLAMLQTLSGTLPVEHPGRMAMLTSLFIGTSVTQASLADIIPRSSESMSLLQIYISIVNSNIIFAIMLTCVMMYTVLRYPSEEPSLAAMFFAFFGIAWPTKSPRKPADNEAYLLQGQRYGSFVNDRQQSLDNVSILSGLSIKQQKEHLQAKNSSSSMKNKFSKSQVDEIKPDGDLSYRNRASDAPSYREIVKKRKATLVHQSASAESADNGKIRTWYKSRYLPVRHPSLYDSNSELCNMNGYVMQMNPNVDAESSELSENKKRQKKRTRGEASIIEECRELKRRWLLYCVALDKTIMYVNLAFNVIVPLVLFILLPAIFQPDLESMYAQFKL